jgi:uncharacterized protein
VIARIKTVTEEHLARGVIGLLALIHLVMALSLLMVLATLERADAQEQPAACGGENLIDRMRAEDDPRLPALLEAAAATPNGEGLLWRVENDQGAASYLLGTMHVADPRVTELSDTVSQALDASETVVIETDEILDPAVAQAALIARPELTMFTDGRTLRTVMSDEDFALVETRLDELGLPVDALVHMKPWMIAGLVALPACEHARKAEGAAFLDQMLAEQALEEGKAVDGLETIAEQLDAMASLSLEFHVRGLVETLSLGPLLEDVTTTMTDLYVAGETGMIMPMLREAAPEGHERDAQGYADFEERIVLARNRIMAERAKPFLNEGHAFIAVGALHLPGDEGVIELLRDAGYSVERAD